ncbi:gp23 [Sphingomonas phage PAU]|uniref:gp23 n=1 Tax=Sphingomonas phage PAU TaxID=1150991 RepID=UPI000257311C|nr:gp23 [Sphingomonas phage PAU]AFF28021.1 gp23 [Sphingomonas phage PAU]
MTNKQKSRKTKGKLILHPGSLLIAKPKFNIAIHPISREVYKITTSLQGIMRLEPVSGSGKVRHDDDITQYLFPYIMTSDNDVYPIDYEWQKVFSLLDISRTFDIEIKTIIGVSDMAFKAEKSRFYSIEINTPQTLKLTQSELITLQTLLKGSKHKLNRIKR